MNTPTLTARILPFPLSLSPLRALFTAASFLLALSVFTGESAKAQTPPPPDCVIFISLGAAGNTATFDNRVIGCVTWTLSYASSGFTGLSLTFQSATGAITAGTFGSYTGTTTTGSNPNTSTTGAISTFSNGTVSTPWLRVLLGGLTGSGNITGIVYGYKTGYPGSAASGTGGCVGTAGTPCIVAGPVAAGSAVGTSGPVQIGISDGTNVRRALGDSSGRQVMIGAAATGAAVTGPPVLAGGSDGTNAQAIKTDTSGRQQIVGPAATGAAVTGAPVYVGGNDGTNVEPLSVDTSGRIQPAGTSTAMADGVSNTQNLPNAAGGVGGVRTFPTLFTGSAWNREYGCTSTIIVDDSASGNTQIIALSGSTQVRICKMSFTTAGSLSIKLTQGTGSNCGSGTADLTGLYQNVLAVAEDFMADKAPVVATAGNAVCLNLSGATRTTGQVWYAQFQ